MIPNMGYNWIPNSGCSQCKNRPFFWCSVGGERVRSLPPAKTEGAPHRVNWLDLVSSTVGMDARVGRGRAPGEDVPRVLSQKENILSTSSTGL